MSENHEGQGEQPSSEEPNQGQGLDNHEGHQKERGNEGAKWQNEGQNEVNSIGDHVQSEGDQNHDEHGGHQKEHANEEGRAPHSGESEVTSTEDHHHQDGNEPKAKDEEPSEEEVKVNHDTDRETEQNARKSEEKSEVGQNKEESIEINQTGGHGDENKEKATKDGVEGISLNTLKSEMTDYFTEIRGLKIYDDHGSSRLDELEKKFLGALDSLMMVTDSDEAEKGVQVESKCKSCPIWVKDFAELSQTHKDLIKERDALKEKLSSIKVVEEEECRREEDDTSAKERGFIAMIFAIVSSFALIFTKLIPLNIQEQKKVKVEERTEK